MATKKHKKSARKGPRGLGASANVHDHMAGYNLDAARRDLARAQSGGATACARAQSALERIGSAETHARYAGDKRATQVASEASSLRYDARAIIAKSCGCREGAKKKR